MATEMRTLETHEAEKATLNESLAFFADSLDKRPLAVCADVLSKDRSAYRIMDAEGVHDAGTVERTRAMWKLTTPDGRLFRSKNADLIAIRVL